MFNLGPISISYYGIAILLGIIAGYFLIANRRKIYNVSMDEIENLAIIMIPLCLLGARIYHVLAEWGYYKEKPGEIFSLRMYGLGLFGAVVTGMIIITVYTAIICRDVRSYVSTECFFTKLQNKLDLAAPALLLGQTVGRLGNYFNKELYGLPTNLPWKIFIPLENRIGGYEKFEYFHPTFLYEIMWNLIGLGFILLLEKKIHPTPPLLKEGKNGIIFSLYLIWYGMGRFLIGFLRLEPNDFWILNDGQIMALLMFFAGLYILNMSHSISKLIRFSPNGRRTKDLNRSSGTAAK